MLPSYLRILSLCKDTSLVRIFPISMPDYVVRIRRGKELKVDKQILRWRRRRKRAQALALKQQELHPDILPPARKLPNIFE